MLIGLLFFPTSHGWCVPSRGNVKFLSSFTISVFTYSIYIKWHLRTGMCVVSWSDSLEKSAELYLILGSFIVTFSDKVLNDLTAYTGGAARLCRKIKMEIHHFILQTITPVNLLSQQFVSVSVHEQLFPVILHIACRILLSHSSAQLSLWIWLEMP